MLGAVLCCAAGLLVGHFAIRAFAPRLRVVAVLALVAMHAAPSFAGCNGTCGVVAPAASFQVQQSYVPAVVVPQAAQVIAPAPVVYQLPPVQAVVQPSYGVVAQQQQVLGGQYQQAAVAPQRQVQKQVSRQAGRQRVILPRRGVSVQRQVSRQR